jgi:hypothetical protein
MRANTIGLIAGAIAVASTANIASAGLVIGDVITLARTSNNGRIVTINYDASRSSSASGVTGGNLALAGTIDFNLQTINGNVAGAKIAAFCVEITESFPDDPITYTMTDLTSVPEESPPGNMSVNQGQMMQDLYSRSYSDAISSANDASWSGYSEEMAAFQLVIWEISHENFSDTSDLSVMKSELDITLGAMVATDYYSVNVLNAANAMIAALGSGGWNTYGQLLGGTSATNQDLLIVVPSPAIAGLACLGLVGMRRRRR